MTGRDTNTEKGYERQESDNDNGNIERLVHVHYEHYHDVRYSHPSHNIMVRCTGKRVFENIINGWCFRDSTRKMQTHSLRMYLSLTYNTYSCVIW